MLHRSCATAMQSKTRCSTLARLSDKTQSYCSLERFKIAETLKSSVGDETGCSTVNPRGATAT